MSVDDTRIASGLWGGAVKKQQSPELPEDAGMPPPLVVPGNRVYVAYENRSRPESLILFCATLPSQFPAYHHLMNMSFDHHYAQLITLFYPFMTVNIRGQRLSEVAHAINFRRCAIVREWHADLYDLADRSKPFIDNIAVMTP